MKSIDHLIGGRIRAGTSGRTKPVFNPASGEQTATVSLATAGEVDAAVRVAHEAYLEWRDVSIAKRTKTMFRFRNLVEANVDALASTLTSEHGKVLSDSAGEVCPRPREHRVRVRPFRIAER